MRLGVIQQVGTPKELYDEPVNLFVAGFMGSPAMSFMPARIEGDTIRLPFLEAKLPEEGRTTLGQSGGGARTLVVGVRAEDFEDAALVHDERSRGATFTTTIQIVESTGSDLLAHFPIEWSELDSGELRKLAGEAGATRLLGTASVGDAVARLDPASKVQVEREAELWVDLTKLHFFDENGSRLDSRPPPRKTTETDAA